MRTDFVEAEMKREMCFMSGVDVRAVMLRVGAVVALSSVFVAGAVSVAQSAQPVPVDSKNTGDAPDDPGPLADVLLAEAEDATDVAGPLGDGVRDVRVDLRQAERDQRGEEDQRSAAGDGVDRAGDEGDARGDEEVDGGHDS